MKKSIFILVCSFIVGLNSGWAANKDLSLVITSLPVTSLLVQHLVQGSDIETKMVVPARYSMAAQKNYFKKNKQFAQSAATASACVTIGSAWRGDALYPFARRHNIHIVEIDAAAPIDRSRTGVVLVTQQQSEEISPYIWRSPANLVRMAEFISDDLQRLFPQHASLFRKNLLTLQRNLFQLRTNFEILLSEKNVGTAASFTDDFDYLTSEFGIEVDRYFLKEEIDWTVEDCLEFSEYLKKNGIKLVLCNRPPQKNIADAIANAGAVAAVLQTLLNLQTEERNPLDIFSQFYSSNLSTIINITE